MLFAIIVGATFSGELVLTKDSPRSSAALLRTPQHIVNQGTIDIRAPDANRIEQRFVIGHEVALIDQFLGKDLLVADIAQHHQPA